MIFLYLAVQVHYFPLWCFLIEHLKICFSIQPLLEEVATRNWQKLQRTRNVNAYNFLLTTAYLSFISPLIYALFLSFLSGTLWLSNFFSWTNYCFRDELKQIVTSDLRQLLGVEGEPTFVKYVKNTHTRTHIAYPSFLMIDWRSTNEEK